MSRAHRSFERLVIKLVTKGGPPNMGLAVGHTPLLTEEENVALGDRLCELGYVGVLFYQEAKRPGRPKKWTPEKLVAFLEGKEGKDLKKSTRRKLAAKAKKLVK